MFIGGTEKVFQKSKLIISFVSTTVVYKGNNTSRRLLCEASYTIFAPILTCAF